MPVICFAPGCKTGYQVDRDHKKLSGEKLYSLFRTPKDPIMFELWQKAIPRVDKELQPYHHLCEIHFKEEDVEKDYKVVLFDGNVWCEKKGVPTLNPNAIPCYFPITPSYPKLPRKNKVAKRKSTPIKKKGKARKKAKVDKIVENESEESDEVCLSSKEKENFIANLLSFQTPAIEKCSVDESELAASLKTEFLDEEAPVKIPQSILRGNSPIAPQASSQQSNDEILTIDSQEIPSQVTPIDTLAEAAHVIFKQENSGEPQDIVTDAGPKDNADEPEVVLPQSVLDEQFTFNFIKVNVNMIDKHNSMWNIFVLDNFIICARWNSNCGLERKIVIKDDLTVKVFLKERQTTIGNDLKLISLETISKLIYRVERTPICPEICNNEGKCHGFLQGTYICRKRNLCVGCIKYEREKAIEEKRRLQEEKKMAQKQVELIRFHFNA